MSIAAEASYCRLKLCHAERWTQLGDGARATILTSNSIYSFLLHMLETSAHSSVNCTAQIYIPWCVHMYM